MRVDNPPKHKKHKEMLENEGLQQESSVPQDQV